MNELAIHVIVFGFGLAVSEAAMVFLGPFAYAAVWAADSFCLRQKPKTWEFQTSLRGLTLQTYKTSGQGWIWMLDRTPEGH